MTKININGKTLIIEDGCNVEVEGDEIRVKPGNPAPQPFYFPIYQPFNPWWIQPTNTTKPYVPPTWPTITCSGGFSSGSTGGIAGNSYIFRKGEENPYVIESKPC